MKIVHRISFSSEPETARFFAECGITIADSGFVSIDVSEDSGHWRAIEQWAERRRPVDIITTKFTSRERDESAWLELVSDWHHGYPQPADDFGYRRVTYEGGCDSCGVGRRQVAPFRVSPSPKWGRRNILQLNWVYDEFFTTPGLWDDLLQSHGVKSRSVQNARGAVLDSILQLDLSSEVEVEVDGLESEVCDSCEQKRYARPVRGHSPLPLDTSLSADLFRSQQWFGSGANSYRLVLLSQRLRGVLEGAMRGASMRPCGALMPQPPMGG
jgi:hypothetical protein